MQRVAFVALAVALIAAALSWLLFGSPPARPEASIAPATTESLPAPTPDADAAASEPGARPSPPPAAERIGDHWLVAETPVSEAGDADVKRVARGSITGRVLWRRSTVPIEGLRVRLTADLLDTVLPIEMPGAARDGGFFLRPRATTDRLGRFELRNVPTDVGKLFLVVDGDGWRELVTVPFVPAPRERVAMHEIWIDERGGITGRVVDESGRPLEGAQVRAVDDPLFRDEPLPGAIGEARVDGAERANLDGTWRGRPTPGWMKSRNRALPFVESTTDGRGRFVLENVRPGRLQLVAQHEQRTARRTDVVVQPGIRTQAGDVTLEFGKLVELRVVEYPRHLEDPAVGVEISVEVRGSSFGTRVVRTDPEGRARVVVTPPSESVTEDELLAMDAKARARAIKQLRRWRKRGDPHAVAVHFRRGPRERWRTRHFSWPAKPNRAVEFELEMPRELEARFVVAAADGTPRPDLPCRLRPSRPGHALQHENGVYLCLGIESGDSGRFVASIPGHAPVVHAFRAEENEPGFREPLILQGVASFPCSVTVVDRDGSPIRGATVSLRATASTTYDHPGSDWAELPRRFAGFSDANGALVLPALWRSNFELTATHPEHGRGVLAFVPQPGEPLVVGIAPPDDLRRGTLRGRLTEDGTRAPARTWRIHAIRIPRHGFAPDVAPEPRSVLTAEDGSFALPELRPGLWRLAVLEPEVPLDARKLLVGRADEARAMTTADAVRDETRYVDLRLDGERLVRRPDLSGTVRINGAARADLVVAAEALHREWRYDPKRSRTGKRPHRRVETWTAIDESAAPIRTDVAGRFEVTGVRAKRVRLTVKLSRNGQWIVLARRIVELGAIDDASRHAIEFDVHTGSLTAELFDASGTPLRGHQIELRRDESEPFVLVANELGMLRADDVPTGEYTLHATSSTNRNLAFAPDRVVIRAGQTTFARLHGTR